MFKPLWALLVIKIFNLALENCVHLPKRAKTESHNVTTVSVPPITMKIDYFTNMLSLSL